VTVESFEYEARYGWNRQTAWMLGVAAVFCVVMLAVPAPLWARIFVIGFFGGGAVAVILASARRATAFRIDALGATLCSSPLYARSTTRSYPWHDIEQVVIWQSFNMDYVGLKRRVGAPPVTGRFTGPRSERAATMTAPGIPRDVVVTGIAANAWVLDRKRLIEAVAHFAPTVRVRDATTGDVLHSAQLPPNIGS
jgi:hypothetical protein